MAGPATSASDPRALQLVAVMAPCRSLGTMVARVWGRTPKITRRPSSACNNQGKGSYGIRLMSEDLRMRDSCWHCRFCFNLLQLRQNSSRLLFDMVLETHHVQCIGMSRVRRSRLKAVVSESRVDTQRRTERGAMASTCHWTGKWQCTLPSDSCQI